MFLNLIYNKKEIETFVKRYLGNAVKSNSYNYTTFGKIVEDLIADSLDIFFSRKYNIKKDQCKRAKDKNEFPDYLLLGKYAIDFKSAIDSEEPENDLGTINSWPDKIRKFGGNNIYFLFVKYSVHNDDTVSICEVYFDNFYKFIGKSKLNTLKYREKDGNLRPKTWICFSKNINEWETLEEFISAFEITKSTRARRLVEKHFKDMTPEDKDEFINEILKRRKNDESYT